MVIQTKKIITIISLAVFLLVMVEVIKINIVDGLVELNLDTLQTQKEVPILPDKMQGDTIITERADTPLIPGTSPENWKPSDIVSLLGTFFQFIIGIFTLILSYKTAKSK
jgi:hypothetical protein